MNSSETTNELASALAKAQGEMKPAVFDKVNPHLKNRYASLTSIMESIKAPMAKNGLASVQSLVGSGDSLRVVTTVLHSSGQWIADDGVPLLLTKQDMQGLGSAITYAKRYGISALLSIVTDDDDDAESAPKEPAVANMTVVKAAEKKEPAKVALAPVAKQEQPPVMPDYEVCCGKKSMISKQNTSQFYCVKCRTSRPRVQEQV